MKSSSIEFLSDIRNARQSVFFPRVISTSCLSFLLDSRDTTVICLMMRRLTMDCLSQRSLLSLRNALHASTFVVPLISARKRQFEKFLERGAYPAPLETGGSHAIFLGVLWLRTGGSSAYRRRMSCS